jgi:hypothetical protein
MTVELVPSWLLQSFVSGSTDLVAPQRDFASFALRFPINGKGLHQLTTSLLEIFKIKIKPLEIAYGMIVD